MLAVAGLASGQKGVDAVAAEIGLEVDFGRETATRATECLTMLPPFASAAVRNAWQRETRERLL
jgi:hypothetical protein